MSALSEPIFVDDRELERRTGIKVTTWRSWRARGGGPDFVRISCNCVRYRWETVEAWLAARTVAGRERGAR